MGLDLSQKVQVAIESSGSSVFSTALLRLEKCGGLGLFGPDCAPLFVFSSTMISLSMSSDQKSLLHILLECWELDPKNMLVNPGFKSPSKVSDLSSGVAMSCEA